MFGLFKSKHSDEEKKYLGNLTATLLSMGVDVREADKIASELLDEAVKRADKANLRGVKTLGSKLARDERYTAKRLKAGLTLEDIERFLNRDYVLIVLEALVSDRLRFSFYQLHCQEGKSSAEAVHALRKTFIYLDDPEKSHQNYQGEDADIYPEFTIRHERWRNRISPDDEMMLANKYSTYNAMVRDLIRKGEL